MGGSRPNRARQTGEVEAAGTTWLTYERTPKVQRSLVTAEPSTDGLTTLITGTGTFEELTASRRRSSLSSPEWAGARPGGVARGDGPRDAAAGMARAGSTSSRGGPQPASAASGYDGESWPPLSGESMSVRMASASSSHVLQCAASASPRRHRRMLSSRPA